MRCRGTLHTGWTLRPIADQTPAEVPVGIAGAEIAARVPGAVHTDLLAAELIPDPYLDQNEAELTWIWRTGWRYETRFTFPGESTDRVDLVCDGLDTIATVEVNGTQVASTANMHRSYRFEVTRLLRAGDNRLAISFGSALNHAERERDRMGYLPVPTTASAHPINFIRKMACNFGWDWGPALITAGIWRPIALESWSTARLARVRPAVTVTGGHGRVRVAVDLERAGASTGLQLLARVAGRQVHTVVRPTATQATLDIDVPNPDLWWPQGYGEHPLYDLQVELREASESAGHEQAPLDTWTARVGFRTVELDTRDDAIGSAFTVVVNGTPIVAKGAKLDPRRLFPQPARCRPVPAANRAEPRRQHQSAADLGRRHLRKRRLLRRVRRAGRHGLAGLPVRLRRLPGRGADPQRGDRRGPGQRRPADAAPEPGAVERQQRELHGLARMGLARVRR